MSVVQDSIAILEEKGWTLASIGREIGQSSVTVESWKAGTRSPANARLVIAALDELTKRKRIPKKRYYVVGSRRKVVN